jgi:hypothetical protein
MKAFLTACVAFGAMTFAALPPATAQVVIGGSGVHVRIGPRPHPWHHAYWEHRRWEERREGCYYHGC